jgi:hypothetical protein
VLCAGVGGASAATHRTRADYGCDRWRPFRVGVSPPEWDALVRVCDSLSGRKISLTNISGVVAYVNLPPQTTFATVVEPHRSTFAVTAALAAVPGGCGPSVPQCVVPSGGTMFARGTAWMHLTFGVATRSTLEANSARFIGSWVESKVTSPGRRFLGSVTSCAGDVAALGERTATWVDALRIGITVYSSCGALLSEVRRETPTQVERVHVARRVIGFGKIFAGGSWVDELTYALARILRR